ncbi:hypothetical protein D3C81_1618630 [compost metagenome]
MSGDVAFRDTRQLRNVLAQFVRAQRTVQAKAQRLDVAHRVIEGFGGLARQGTAGGVGDGAGNHDRQRNAQGFKFGFHREGGGFGVQGIEDGFDHDQIDTAFHQRTRRFAVGFHQLIERNITERRIVDVR